METLLTIDPGNCTGWALFRGGALASAGVTAVDDRQCPALAALLGGGVNAIVIELPQVYRAGLSKGDPNDLIKVALGVGRWVERATVCGASVRLVRPAEWKGQVPKHVHHTRVQGALEGPERACIPTMPQAKAHNMLDAIALGLWHYGRIR